MKKYTTKDRLKGFLQTFLFLLITVPLSNVIGQFLWSDMSVIKLKDLPVLLISCAIVAAFCASWGNPYMFRKNDTWAWNMWRRKSAKTAPQSEK